MPSEKFRIATNGQSLRNPSNGFFGMTLSANLTVNENDLSAHNDRKSAHNALERQRREHLNMKFQQLAHVLPSLQTVRRPSKTMIVSKSLEFVSASLRRESKYTSEIQKLRLENEKLKRQAEAASKHTKKQQISDEQKQTAAINKTSSKDKSTATVMEKKTSLKRRASSDLQLSPPPTPTSLISSNNEANLPPSSNKNDISSQQSPIAPPQKKKRTMKQSKASPTTSTTQLIPPITPQPFKTTTPLHSPEQINPVPNHFSMSTLTRFATPSADMSMVTPLKELPWSPGTADRLHPSLTNDFDIQASNYFTVSSSPYNIMNNPPHSPSTISSTSTSYYLTSTSPNIDLYNPQPDASSLPLRSFPTTTNDTSVIHPMLLAPYFISAPEGTSVPNDFVYPTTTSASTQIQNQEYQQSNSSNFYLP